MFNTELNEGPRFSTMNRLKTCSVIVKWQTAENIEVWIWRLLQRDVLAAVTAHISLQKVFIFKSIFSNLNGIELFVLNSVWRIELYMC